LNKKKKTPYAKKFTHVLGPAGAKSHKTQTANALIYLVYAGSGGTREGTRCGPEGLRCCPRAPGEGNTEIPGGHTEFPSDD
jgi:hypothetical protein